ncbi:MAG: hypothetical protein PHI34_14700, partial [Acidobacteriota bacterium]|nr:hypothetical protein [Acidobacteriota bacterium]
GLGGYLLSRPFKAGRGSAEVGWTVIDEAYQPANAVEAFIKDDAANRESLPVSIRAYGKDAKILRRFKGKQFARPNEQVLALYFKGMDDWMIMDIKYKAENGRETTRTMLYILAGGQWKVADAGTLLE